MAEDNTGWIGVDLDGTLAEYTHWRGNAHIGPPVPRMVRRVKDWLAAGRDVRVFTARVGPQGSPGDVARAREAIAAWCREHVGRTLPVTAIKDFTMVELWDDRCVQVVPNTGQRMDGCEEGGGRPQEIAREALARLSAGALPRDRLEYERALLMAAMLGRRMGPDKLAPVPLGSGKITRRTGLGLPMLSSFFVRRSA
jgi:hypothetical protein